MKKLVKLDEVFVKLKEISNPGHPHDSCKCGCGGGGGSDRKKWKMKKKRRIVLQEWWKRKDGVEEVEETGLVNNHICWRRNSFFFLREW